jgi:hypothetical protein
MPPVAVQRKARSCPAALRNLPTTTEPSAETPLAQLLSPPSVPRSCMPPVAVQRKARSCPAALRNLPTTTEPSAETPKAQLVSPPSVPSHLNEGSKGGGGAEAPPPPQPDNIPTTDMPHNTAITPTTVGTAFGVLKVLCLPCITNASFVPEFWKRPAVRPLHREGQMVVPAMTTTPPQPLGQERPLKVVSKREEFHSPQFDSILWHIVWAVGVAPFWYTHLAVLRWVGL